VARDRKRAKQRRERRGTAAAVRGTSYGDGASQAAPGQVVRADLPGALEHAGAEVDEFDAALIRGAGGVPLAPEEEAAMDEAALDEAARESGPSDSDDALQDLQAPGGPTAPGGPPGGGGGGGGGSGGEAERPSGAPLRGGNRAIGFLRASWAELQRVQWPDRRQVTQATAVVLGFVAIAGAYLGFADFVAKEIVEYIL
jgi:preprotein translocase SecE subunit